MYDIEYIKRIHQFKEEGGLSKELALVRIAGKSMYLIGFFGENKKCISGMTLTKSEMASLFKLKEKVLTEEEKFQRDYIQQAHNGSAEEREKEKEKW